MNEGNIAFLIFMAMALPLTLFISGFLIKKAIVKVVEIFCQHNALGINHAKTIEELGLQPPDFLERLISFRDYKPYALQILGKKGIVRVTPDGKLYMVEDLLDESLRCKMNDLLLSNLKG